MKAIVQDRYGAPEDLSIEEVPEPTPGPGEVRVRVVAAAVNDWDWAMCRGTPLYIRALCGPLRPRVRTPGVDVAGIVDAVGPDVESRRPGDRVFGDLSEAGFGAFAESVCTRADALHAAPGALSLREAAALPHAAALALQGLRDVGGLRAGERVLVNGAGGGVGTLAVQLARHFGVAELTAVDHGDKLEALQALGYSRTLDYRSCDFTREGQLHDLILDARSDRSPFAYARALRPGGRYVTVGGSTGRLLQIVLLGRLAGRGGRRLRVLALKPNRDLDQVRELCDAGVLRPVVDRVFTLDETPAAIRRFGDGLHTGKIVIEVGDE